MAEMEGFYFTGEDVALFKGLLAEAKQRRNFRSSRPPDDVGQSPDSYIALVPADGIPALDSMGTFSDQPGFAICDIYTIQNQDTDSPELVPLNFQAKVFNIGASDIAADSWVLIHRDKFGNWIAGVKYASAGTGSITVKATDNTPTLTGIDILNIDEHDGAVGLVGTGTTATLSFNDASATVSGFVNRTTQTIKGAKTFQDFAEFQSVVQFDGGWWAPTASPSTIQASLLGSFGQNGSGNAGHPSEWFASVAARTGVGGGGFSNCGVTMFPLAKAISLVCDELAVGNGTNLYYIGTTTTAGDYYKGIYVGATSGPKLADGDYTGVTVSGSGTIITTNAGSIGATEIANSLKPSGTAAAGTESLRALGTTAGTAAAGNDSRLSDTRTPTDASVTGAKLTTDAILSLQIFGG